MSPPSRGMWSLSLHHRVRCVLRCVLGCVPDPAVTVEGVFVGVGEQVSCENIFSALWMNKAVVVFVPEETLVKCLIEQGVWVSGSYQQRES